MIFNAYGNQENPIILFLHGGGVGGWMWEEQVKYFEKNYYLLVPELPLSNPQFTIRETALEINQILANRIEKQKVILVGFSIGAQISIAMIGNNPNIFSAALINSALTIPIYNRFMDVTLKYSYPLTKSRLFAKVQVGSMGVPDKYFNTYFEQSLNFTKEAFLNMMKENMNFHIPATFYEARIPLLFTIGSKEQKIVKQSYEKLLNNTLNSTGHVFEKVAHNAPFKVSSEFNRVLENWTKEIVTNE